MDRKQEREKSAKVRLLHKHKTTPPTHNPAVSATVTHFYILIIKYIKMLVLMLNILPRSHGLEYTTCICTCIILR